jgi:hypothetical protein
VTVDDFVKPPSINAPIAQQPFVDGPFARQFFTQQ